MKKIILFATGILLLFSACSKTEDPYASYDPNKQLAIDDELVKKYVSDNKIENVQFDTKGIYYIIKEHGEAKPNYTTQTKISVKYEGRLLANGNMFDSGTGDFTLGGLIAGWQLGIPKIGQGGKMRLIVASPLAYGPVPGAGIPAHSVLDFEIELLKVQN